MSRVDAYVEGIYRNFKGDRQDLLDLKQEMKQHLNETMQELQEQGYSEADSFQIAVERFGEERDLSREIEEMYRDQRTFAKGLLWAAILVLLIGGGLLAYFTVDNIRYHNARDGLHQQFMQVLGQNPEWTDATKQKLEQIARENAYKELIYIAVYRTNKDTELPSYRLEDAIFTYPADAQRLPSGYGSGSNDTWTVEQQDTPVTGPSPYEIAYISCFSASWILFALWAIINAYHQKRLTVLWIIGFSLFNILAYALFRIRRRWLY